MADRWHVIEAEILPRDLDELVVMRDRLIERGYSRAMVAGCLEFLVGKAKGREVPMSPQSRAQYRKMLAALASNGGRPPDETGAASLVLLAAVAGVIGTVAAASTGHPAGLAALAPIIHDSVNPEDELAARRNCCWEPPALLAA